jgi:hypothetical protein
MKKEIKVKTDNPFQTKCWSKLSKVNKRKALAWDVIYQVNVKKVKASPGNYCPNDIELDYKVESQKILSSTDNSCKVCAMGALMTVDILNRNSFKGAWSGFTIEHRFDGIFSQFQLRLIETAFEQGIVKTITGLYDYSRHRETPIAKKAIAFGRKFRNNNNRLIAIMNNIIEDEKGLFLGEDF